MPKIDAPTVAEHRARQEQALLDAARELLLEAGPKAVTPASVGARVGLARNSVYKYFRSGEQILARIVSESFASWGEKVRAVVEAAGSPEERIDAYVATTLELATAGEHRIAILGGGAPAGDSERDQLARAHHDLAAPLRAALAERGDPAPDLTAELIDGALGRAIDLLDAGRPAEQVTATAVGFVRRAVGISTHAHQPQIGKQTPEKKEQPCSS